MSNKEESNQISASAAAFAGAISHLPRELTEHQIAELVSPLGLVYLKPDVLMMEPAEDWYSCDTSDLLRPLKIRSILIQ